MCHLHDICLDASRNCFDGLWVKQSYPKCRRDKAEDPKITTSLGSAGFNCSIADLSCGERKQQADRIIGLLDDIRDSDPDSFALIMAAAKNGQGKQQ